jgi:ZIP family zinc transporter
VIALLKLLPFVSVGIGALLALRVDRYLHIVYGLAGGIMLGLAAFHLLPDIAHANAPDVMGVPLPFILIGVAFCLFYLVEEVIAGGDPMGEMEAHGHVGVLGALTLVAHSFIDGLAIGLGFAMSMTIGVSILIAVLAHDFAEGATTATLLKAHGTSRRATNAIVLLAAITPVVGAFIGGALQVSETFLACYGGFFVGTLIFFATHDILPNARARTTPGRVLVLVVIGMAFILAVSIVEG